MNSQSALNRAKMNRLNAITELNALRTNFENKQQMVADSDSTIAAEKEEIRKKKEEIFETLKEIVFVTVGLSVVDNKEKEFRLFDDAMEYQIARNASEDELVLDVINASLV